MVVHIRRGAAAEEGDLRVNDLLVSVRGQPVDADADQLVALLSQIPADGTVDVQVVRAGELHTLHLKRRGSDKFFFWSTPAPILEVAG
jgi:S1-C subfamily serine protease